MTYLIMVQITRQLWQLWQLESDNGVVLKDDLLMKSAIDATAWVKAYVSSHPAWGFKVKPLKKEGI